MTAFPIHTPETAPEGSKPLLAAVAKAWGFVPKLQATLAESPTTLEAYDTLFALASRGTLAASEQQVVFLAVSVLHGCEYCASGHTYLARAAGLDEAAVSALRDGAPIPDARLEVLRTFAEAMVRERGRVGDGRVDAFLDAGFTRAQALEVVTIIATKTISNYVNHVAHTPRESFMADPSIGWTAPQSPRLAG